MAFTWTHSDITALTVRERKHWAKAARLRTGLEDGEKDGTG